MPDALPRDAQERRPPRADARRNRERVLAAAREAFAAEGPSVSLDEIARRAGLGAGTVHRHFPTKEELLKAVIADRLTALAEEAAGLAGAGDAGEAFFSFFHRLVATARGHLALSAAFAGAEELADAVREPGASLQAAIGVLLSRAQESGAVRGDIGPEELHAIIGGVLVMERRLSSAASRGRAMAVVVDGLRASS
ncbi:TetR/AcrR family transcriptional regulator [Sphaerisporangium corydalis]|uniref:TetR/AcrR family transcriptional regulator n=1 Tax=Sphaerisporangium corydalis TaxID=1441875 RepID=A0ABV9EBT1_9ACTN|nr:TetR/AcrR family transcriptional regulator [Sphaerisporangium corydalis]